MGLEPWWKDLHHHPQLKDKPVVFVQRSAPRSSELVDGFGMLMNEPTSPTICPL